MSQMSDYFELAEAKDAVLLDASNFDVSIYPIMGYVKKVLSKVMTNQIELGYDDPHGTHELRELIAKYESQRESIELNENNVTINKTTTNYKTTTDSNTFINESISLDTGANSFTAIAYDIAGNQERTELNIYYYNTIPAINTETRQV